MGVTVVDACVVVDAFSGTGSRGRAAALALRDSALVAPHHLDIEVLGAWRKQLNSDHFDPVSANLAVSLFRKLRVQRFDYTPMLPRIWELRNNLTMADAAYVALSEQLGVPLLTCDARLANAPGTKCEFELIS